MSEKCRELTDAERLKKLDDDLRAMRYKVGEFLDYFRDYAYMSERAIWKLQASNEKNVALNTTQSTDSATGAHTKRLTIDVTGSEDMKDIMEMVGYTLTGVKNTIRDVQVSDDPIRVVSIATFHLIFEKVEAKEQCYWFCRHEGGFCHHDGRKVDLDDGQCIHLSCGCQSWASCEEVKDANKTE